MKLKHSRSTAELANEIKTPVKTLDVYLKKVDILQPEYPLSTNELHCVKSVRIWSFSGLYFPAFGLNTERSLRT